jgi:hypothetical protein
MGRSLMFSMAVGASRINTVEFMKRARPGFKWTHEDASQMMLQDLIDKNGIDSLSTDDVGMIKNLISGEIPSPSFEKKVS